jgi:glycosyltransferase involved in cell wall biosynthesis
MGRAMSPIPSSTSELRVALFSGNYNMVTDGANKALNRLVGYLLAQGARVRIYSPTVPNPAFAPTGDLVSVPSVAIPGRAEYRIAMGLPLVRRDLAEFAPNVVHVSSPDIAAHRAISWACARGIPVLGSVHTRFDTYPRYYNMAWIEPLLTAVLRRFHRRCDALVAPSESFAQVLRDQRMNYDISLCRGAWTARCSIRGAVTWPGAGRWALPMMRWWWVSWAVWSWKRASMSLPTRSRNCPSAA